MKTLLFATLAIFSALPPAEAQGPIRERQKPQEKVDDQAKDKPKPAPEKPAQEKPAPERPAPEKPAQEKPAQEADRGQATPPAKGATEPSESKGPKLRKVEPKQGDAQKAEGREAAERGAAGDNAGAKPQEGPADRASDVGRARRSENADAAHDAAAERARQVEEHAAEQRALREAKQGEHADAAAAERERQNRERVERQETEARAKRAARGRESDADTEGARDRRENASEDADGSKVRATSREARMQLLQGLAEIETTHRDRLARIERLEQIFQGKEGGAAKLAELADARKQENVNYERRTGEIQNRIGERDFAELKNQLRQAEARREAAQAKLRGSSKEEAAPARRSREEDQ